MQSFHDALSRPKRPGGRRAAAGAAVLLAVLSPVFGGSPARAAAGAARPAAGTAGAVSTAGTAGAVSSDRLLSGQTLQPGQSLTGGHDTLTMQANGNLVLLAPGHTPLWSTRTSGSDGASLVMQPNGNLAVVAPGGQTLWSAGTGHHSGSTLILQPNGNAVISPAPASIPPDSTPPASAPLWSTNTFRQTYADIQLTTHGWVTGQARQFGCLNNIWLRESKWDELAGDPASAYGIPQASPGAKMAAAGPDWLTSPQTQIRWGEDYIQGQYGTPCQAWAYWQVHKNY